MRFLRAESLLLTLAFLIVTEGVGADSLLDRASSGYFLNSQRSSLAQQALGSLCSVMTLPSHDIPCNPALLPTFEEKVFGINLVLENDYNTVYKNRDLLDGKDKFQLAENLLSERKPIRFEATSQIWWRSPYWSLSFQPLRWTYYSRVRNQAYPDIAVYGMQEQTLQLQWAGYLDKNWSVGFSLRGLDRRFVYDEFNLFEAIPHLDDYFQVKTQRILWLEPGVSYLIESEELAEWQPRVSLLVSQLGYVDHAYDQIPTKPYLDSGFSFRLPHRWSIWEWGLSYRFITSPDYARKWRLGTQYKMRFVSLLAAYDSDEWSLGLQAHVWGWGLGFLYKRQSYQDVTGTTLAEDSRAVEATLTW